jgi:phosphoserine phosphatase
MKRAQPRRISRTAFSFLHALRGAAIIFRPHLWWLTSVLMDLLVVDLCGTLILENTTREFVRRLRLSPGAALLRAFALSRFAAMLGSLTGRDLVRSLLIRCLRGQSKSGLETAARDYVKRALAEKNNPRVLLMIREAKLEYRQVYLATASLAAIALAVVQELQLDGYIASDLAYEADDICTGGLALDATGNKWNLLLSRFPRFRDSHVTVVTDNVEDDDLMLNATVAYRVAGDATILEAKDV